MSGNLMRNVAAILVVFLVGQVGCDRHEAKRPASRKDEEQGPADGSPGNAPGNRDAKAARRAKVIAEMRQRLKTAKKAVATPPPAEVRRNLIGAWRIDAKLEDGQWVQWHDRAGKSEDIEFRADGTLQAYLGTLRMDGTYQTSPGNGCVDVLMTLGKLYTYAYSIAFEQDRLLMTYWERTEFDPERIIKSVEDARRKGTGLTRYYRVKGFLSDD